MADAKPPDENGKTAILQSLAKSPDRWVQFGTLLLVGISGLGTFFQTDHLGRQAQEDRDRAVRQINQMYQRIDEFEHRQMQMLKNQTDILESNNQQLKNQNELLENQRDLLRLLKEGQIQFLQRQQRLFQQSPEQQSSPPSSNYPKIGNDQP